jgi:hypothetical protein
METHPREDLGLPSRQPLSESMVSGYGRLGPRKFRSVVLAMSIKPEVHTRRTWTTRKRFETNDRW